LKLQAILRITLKKRKKSRKIQDKQLYEDDVMCLETL